MSMTFDQAIAELRQRKSEPNIAALAVITVLSDEGIPGVAYAALRYISVDTPLPLRQYVSPDYLEGSLTIRWHGGAPAFNVSPESWDLRLDLGGGLVKGPIDILRRSRGIQTFPGPLLWIKLANQNTPSVSVKLFRDGSFIRGIGAVVSDTVGIGGLGMYSLIISQISPWDELNPVG